MIRGYYYLHENKDLIYKPGADSIIDIRDSDLCKAAWACDTERATGWQILVEALSLDANKTRIKELADLWKCNDEDAQHYAEYLGIKLGEDGTLKTAAVIPNEGPCGFGDTYLEAMAGLCHLLGYTGGKMWTTTFQQLINKKREVKVDGS
jgi:hypothetical protein